jgi:hypothetical protein
MKRKTIIHVFLAGMLFLSACEKDTDIFVPDHGQLNGPDTSWQPLITNSMAVSNLKASLLFDPYIDSIEVNANTATLLTPSGLQLIFPPNCCVSSAGQPITGKVQVELMLIKKKGDMIRLDKPTTWNDTLLVTSGQIFVRLKKNGVAVQLAPTVKINIKYSDTPIISLMKFFAGDETSSHFNWIPNPDPNNNTFIAGSQHYEILTNRLRWISGSHQFDFTGFNKINVSATLAPYFTNTNTIAFVVFKDFRSVVSMRADFNSRKFITGKLPSGKAITVVVISKQVNDYYLGYSAAVTSSPTPSTTQFIPVTPIKRSLPDILNYLSTL